mmetsp:Transcript_36545/g.88573  ORF Transcript_36545/g.88573 Transcript_36545/m.88573 type:complete len:88 (+) Transcript_36545:313-576(+)
MFYDNTVVVDMERFSRRGHNSQLRISFSCQCQQKIFFFQPSCTLEDLDLILPLAKSAVRRFVSSKKHKNDSSEAISSLRLHVYIHFL